MKKNKNTITRRQAIKRIVAGTAGLALLPHLDLAAIASMIPKAKAVIQIWMWGGPSHLDTFDPKPEAGYDYCGPFDKTIATNVDGIKINPLLPKLAKLADKYSIIRSMTHGNNGHETAAYMVQSGHEPDRLVHPSFGALVSLFKGYDHGYKGIIPPYVVLTKPQGRFSEAGFLGQKHKPFATGGDPNRPVFEVEGLYARGVSDEHQNRRRDLLHSLDSLGKSMPSNAAFKQIDQTEQEAYDLMFGEARDIFDLKQEKDNLRDEYGRNTFGQSCLVARRLIEKGVPYVTINYNGWDTHKMHFETMNKKLPELDNGMATLLRDLDERGLLKDTIIWWSGEFGRGPKVQWGAPWNGGRSHYGKCFSAVVAGGGFKGGQILGSSDAKGMEVAERPVYPQDLLRTMCGLLGINPDASLPNPRNLDLTVMPKAQQGDGELKELV